MTSKNSSSDTDSAVDTAKDELSIGSPAPAFDLVGDDGQRHTLSQFQGRRVILYFYPKDDTPGCTQEACDFRDSLAAPGGNQDQKTVIIGVSPDSIESHKKFKAKYSLPFLLLSDPGAQLAQRYGAYGEKNMYGKKSMGIIRSTFVIGTSGAIEAVYKRVSVKGHVAKVLEKAA
jgi:peroxiredoxin Q/BCP